MCPSTCRGPPSPPPTAQAGLCVSAGGARQATAREAGFHSADTERSEFQREAGERRGKQGVEGRPTGCQAVCLLGTFSCDLPRGPCAISSPSSRPGSCPRHSCTPSQCAQKHRDVLNETEEAQGGRQMERKQVPAGDAGQGAQDKQTKRDTQRTQGGL